MKYRYAVASTLTLSKPFYESPLSDPVKVSPVDTFPPPCPKGVSAVALPGVVELFWERVGARAQPDFGGYHVYRTMEGSAGRERLTETPIREERYSDRSALPGVRYRYEATAVDTAEPPNESGPCSTVEVTAAAR